MVLRVTVLSIIFLYIENISSSCDEVFSKRFSKEYIILKNQILKQRDDCISGVVLQSKFDGSFYCVSKNQNVAKAENMHCLRKTQEDCQCGKENPPPSRTNRIMYPTGMISEFYIKVICKSVAVCLCAPLDVRFLNCILTHNWLCLNMNLVWIFVLPCTCIRGFFSGM